MEDYLSVGLSEIKRQLTSNGKVESELLFGFLVQNFEPGVRPTL